LKTPFLENLGFFKRIPEQLSFFKIFLWFYIDFTRRRLLTLDLKMSFCSKALRSKTEITIRSPAAEQGWPAARDGQAPACERLGWGFNSPSVTWWGWFGRKRLWWRSAAREAAVGCDSRNDGEQAGRPANAHAREGPRGASGGHCDAWTRAGAADSGAHQRAPTGGNGGRGGAALSCAQATARREECVGCQAGLMARMHARWLSRLGPGELGAARGHRDGVLTARPGRQQRASAGERARGRGPDNVDRRVVHAVTAYGRWAMWARPRWPTCGPCCDGVRMAGDVGPARGAGAALTARRRVRSALRRPSPFSICWTLLWPIQTQKLWTKVQIRQIWKL
jgi:hypothetical protein